MSNPAQYAVRTVSDGISIIAYREEYGEDAVAMWRDSKEHALGIKEDHSFDEHLRFLEEILVRENDVFIALCLETNSVVGLLATNGKFVNQLYVHRDHQRVGIGSELLKLAKDLSGGRLRLLTFEINAGARSFYESHGFSIIGRGNDNEENLPDLLYEWCAV